MFREKVNLNGFDFNIDLIPWDSEIYGFNVAHIYNLLIKNRHNDYSHITKRFYNYCFQNDIKLVSTRIHADDILKSIFLESVGFRFVEFTYSPQYNLENYQVCVDTNENCIEAHIVDDSAELDSIIAIAKRCFVNERFFVDPRLESNLSNERYGRWVTSAFRSERQNIIRVSLRSQTIGFFLIEESGRDVYWHLHAIDPEFQGKGLGYQTFIEMIKIHKTRNIKTITSKIIAKNLPIINLYSKLGFRFKRPEIGFHWYR